MTRAQALDRMLEEVARGIVSPDEAQKWVADLLDIGATDYARGWNDALGRASRLADERATLTGGAAHYAYVNIAAAIRALTPAAKAGETNPSEPCARCGGTGNADPSILTGAYTQCRDCGGEGRRP